MARKRKHSSSVHHPSPPALPAMPQVTAQSSSGGHSMAVDFDSDSPMGSPDSCSSRSGTSSACSPSSKAEKPPMVRSAANARERSRMRVLSKAFSRLKTTLPWVPADTKLSKLDTLRLASCYIAHLREILADDKPASSLPTDSPAAKAVSAATQGGKKTGSGAQTPIHPLNLTWPFTFNGRVSLTSTSFPDVTSRQKDSLHVTNNKTPITGSS